MPTYITKVSYYGQFDAPSMPEAETWIKDNKEDILAFAEPVIESITQLPEVKHLKMEQSWQGQDGQIRTVRLIDKRQLCYSYKQGTLQVCTIEYFNRYHAIKLIKKGSTCE